MVRVNLLPWRESLRRQSRYFLGIALSLLLLAAILAAGLVAWILNEREAALTYREQMQRLARVAIDKSEAHRQQVKQQITQLTHRYQQQQCQQQYLQRWQQFWPKLSSAIPQALWLTTLTFSEDRVVFHGVSPSILAVNQLQRVLSEHALFSRVGHDSLTRQENAMFAFTLTADCMEWACD